MSELIRTLEKEREAYIASGGSEDKAVAFGLSIAIREIEKQPQLNENQQIVLDWLKSNVEEEKELPMRSVWSLGDLHFSIQSGLKEVEIDEAYCRLDGIQEAQVIEAFGQWARKQEGETE